MLEYVFASAYTAWHGQHAVRGITIFLSASRVSGTPSMTESPLQMTPVYIQRAFIFGTVVIAVQVLFHANCLKGLSGICNDMASAGMEEKVLTVTVEDEGIDLVQELGFVLLVSLLYCIDHRAKIVSFLGPITLLSAPYGPVHI